LNEPTNKPTGPRTPLGLARRPFAAVARISLLAVVVAILGACGAQQGAGDPASPSEPPATEEQATGDGELGPPILGDEDAPVTMVEYADYQ